MFKSFLEIFYILVLLGFIISPFSVFATLAPQIYFTDIKLEKINFQPGEIIKGTVSLWNYENSLMPDLRFSFQLLGKEVNGVPTEMIDQKFGDEIFTLAPGEKTSKSFTYSLPKNLPTGNFVFRVQIVNGLGEESGWIDKVISVGGEGKFLTLTNYWIVKDGKFLHPGGGVGYKIGEIPEIQFDVINESNFTIVAFPKIITYKRNVGGEIINVQKENEISLKPKEKKTIKANLPQLTDPESYLSEVKMYTKNEEPISNSIFFRWVVEGEDATILWVKTEKDNYQAGEEAQVKVQFTGPPHEESNEEGELKVKLYNKEGKVVGEGETKVKLRSGEALVKIPIKENLENPKVEVSISKVGKTLDKYEFPVRPKEKITTQEKKETEKIGFFEKNKKIIFGFGIFIIISLIIYLLKMRGLKTFILLALLGGIFSANWVFAAEEVTHGCCDTTIVYNSPPPNQTYKPGDTINFSGAFKVTSCGNGLFFNKVTFYIAEDKDIPITDCCGDTSPTECSDDKQCTCTEGCTNCYGAKSTSYTSCDFKWCDDVKYLNPSGYKVYKLGEIYPADVASGARPYWVYYNENFTIPNNLGFCGPVRFYVQYSGTHWNDHWHWNITYQKGYIKCSPWAENLRVDTELPAYCNGINYPTAILRWEFKDGDTGDTQSAYQIRIYDLEGNLVYQTPKNQSSTNSFGIPPDAKLSWGKTYKWELKVWDSDDLLESEWIQGPNFTIVKHDWPTVDFTWKPEKPFVNELVTFFDETQVDGTGTTIVFREWKFENATPSVVYNTATATTKFLKTGTMEATLTVRDSDGYQCSKTKYLNVRKPLPFWAPTPSFSPPLWIKKFFASLINFFSYLF
jgi:hypothetical protein